MLTTHTPRAMNSQVQAVPGTRCYINTNTRLRLILMGEFYFHNFQSWEIIGDMYQYTEAFVTIREILQKQKNQYR